MSHDEASIPEDLDLLAAETAALVATVAGLHQSHLREPSRCSAWDRAHVISHLIGNAGALGRLTHWATTGVPTPAYDSMEQRESEIERGAWSPAPELRHRHLASTRAFAEAAETMRDGVRAERLELGGHPVNAYALPAMRTSEVVMHHADLDAGWELESADPRALATALGLYAPRLSARDDMPAMVVRTTEGWEHVFGDGGTVVTGTAAAVLRWLGGRDATGVSADGALPRLPDATL